MAVGKRCRPKGIESMEMMVEVCGMHGAVVEGEGVPEGEGGSAVLLFWDQSSNSYFGRKYVWGAGALERGEKKYK